MSIANGEKILSKFLGKPQKNAVRTVYIAAGQNSFPENGTAIILTCMWVSQ